MKNVLFLTLLTSCVSIFSMNEEHSLAISQEHACAPADESREEADRELVNAFIAFKPGLAEFKLNENDLMKQMREQQALINARRLGIQKATQDDSSADVYIQILGENYDLIEADISSEELDQRVNTLWTREAERIKRCSLAAFERDDTKALIEDTIKSTVPPEIIDPEQIGMMVRVACGGVIESIEAHGVSTLRERIDYMRQIYAVHRKIHSSSTSSAK